MDEPETSMPERLRIIFRVLSVVTSLEGAFGLCGTAMTALVFPFVRTALENVAAHPYSDTTLLLYLMTLTNVAFDVQLLIASIFLWKLQRRGLFLLVYTLLAETFYFVGIVAVETHFKL